MNFQDQYDVIAAPLNKNFSGGGIVRILFYYDQDGVIRNIDKNIFPSGKCWIINDYASAIEVKYGQEGQENLFRISGITKTNNTNDGAVPPENFVEWCCTNGNKVSAIGHELVRIIECELPDKDTGEVNLMDEVLPRGVYFISDNGAVHGPFEITIDLVGSHRKYIASAFNTPSITIPTHHVTKVSLDELFQSELFKSCLIDGKEFAYLTGLKSYGRIMKDKWEVMDYISASQLMKFVSDLKSKNANRRLMSNSTLSQVKQDLEAILKERHNHLTDQERYSRAIYLLSLDKTYKDTWFDVLSAYVKTDAGQKALSEYVVESSLRETDQKIKEIDEQAKKKKSDLNQVDNEIQNRKIELESLKLEIRVHEEKLSRTKEEVEEKIRDQNKILQSEMISLQNALENLRQEYTVLKKQYEQLQSLDSINEEIGHLERDRTRLSVTVEKLKGTLQNPITMMDKMTEVHAVMDILGYSQRTPSVATQNKKYSPNKRAENLDLNREAALNVIHTLTHRVATEGGRELSETETANILVCLQQNFLTILQGKPGTGKTSTIINIAKALGIHNPDVMGGHESDFLNIPVARGWTGTRDLLGFYNGLRGTFQSAKTGLYEFLVNGEEAGDSSNIRVVLLDEANLSPIEHYWSDFIGLSDRESSTRAIDTGAPNEFRFLHPAKYNSLRFLATINNDSTTEPLSPRLLSRAPVISMDKFNQVDEPSLGGKIIDLDGALGAKALESLFGRNSILRVESRGEDLYEELQKIISSGINSVPSLRESLHLEGRKQQSIIRYLDVAGELIPDSLAQDFALSQFILPHLKGDGDKVRQALEVMIAQAKNNNLERSAQILERIAAEGDNYLHSYSFL